jgi:hypothetical protein
MSVNDIRSAQLTKLLLKELPFYNINITYESSFNNSITTNLPTLKDLDKYPIVCVIWAYSILTQILMRLLISIQITGSHNINIIHLTNLQVLISPK